MSVRRHPASAPRAFGRPGRIAAAVGAVAVACLVVLVGWRAGAATTPDRPSAPGQRTAPLGSVRAVVSAGWRPAHSPRPLVAAQAGLQTAEFAVAPGLDARAVLFSARTPGDVGVPRPLRALAGGRLSPPRRARLAGAAAWSYPPRETPRGRVVQLTVLPTTAGVVGVACVADRLVWAVTAQGCATDVQGLDLGSARALPLGSDGSFRSRLPASMRELRAARARERRALSAATTAAGQARHARALAATYARAAAQLKGITGSTPSAEALVRSLTAVDQAYRALAMAASSGRRDAYVRARQSVVGAERQLAERLRPFQAR